MPADRPFPFEAVRDLLGLLRAMWFAAHDNPARMARIQRLGLELAAARDLAAESKPGTRAYASAWDRAENVTRQLGDLVELTTQLQPTIEHAAERVTDGIKAGRQRARVAAQRGK